MTDIIKLPEGESGVQKGFLTEERVEACAAYWGTPEKDRQATVLEYGKMWGLSAAKLREAKSDKRVLAKVEEKIKLDATYLAVECLDVLGEIVKDPEHKERLKAVRLGFEAAGMLKGGPQIQNNNMVVQPYEHTYESLTDEEIAEQVERVAKERGWVKPDTE